MPARPTTECGRNMPPTSSTRGGCDSSGRRRRVGGIRSGASLHEERAISERGATSERRGISERGARREQVWSLGATLARTGGLRAGIEDHQRDDDDEEHELGPGDAKEPGTERDALG